MKINKKIIVTLIISILFICCINGNVNAAYSATNQTANAGESISITIKSTEKLENFDIADVILQILDEINDGGKVISTKLYERIVLSVAKSGAIRAGKKLTNIETEKLLEDLLALPEPNYTPDGKKIIAILDVEQIGKLL